MDLKQKMEDWGPWGEKENKVLIFSLGNEYEVHGPALQKDTDSRIAKFVSKQALETGQRMAHYPISTDVLAQVFRIGWQITAKEIRQRNHKFINDYHDQSIQVRKY